MDVLIFSSAQSLGQYAAQLAGETLRKSLTLQPEARMVMATGASQFELIKELIQIPDIDWNRVTVFHLDEYIGLPSVHPASFRKYLKERFANHLNLRAFHEVKGDALDPKLECYRLGNLINQAPIDLSLIGIGENGHIAFNDPPADFETDKPYIIVELDNACRQQQVGEGWFSTIDDVPKQAISMSVRQILKTNRIICCVPDLRKALAVRKTINGQVTPQVPASILRNHPACSLLLDTASASLLSNSHNGQND